MDEFEALYQSIHHLIKSANEMSKPIPRDSCRPSPPSAATAREKTPLRVRINCEHELDKWSMPALTPPTVTSMARPSLETTVAALRKQNRDLEAANQKLSASEAKTRELSAQVSALTTDKDYADNEWSNARKDCAQLQQQIQALTAERDAQQSARSEMSAKLAAAQKAWDELQKRYQTSISENNKLKEKYVLSMQATADCSNHWGRVMKDRTQKADHKLAESRKLVAKLEAKIEKRNKWYTKQLDALKKQSKRFQNEAFITKRQLLKEKYKQKRVKEMHKWTANGVAVAVDANGRRVMDEIKRELLELIDRKQNKLAEDNTAAEAEGIQQLWTQEQTIDSAADRISTELDQNIMCPECEKRYVGAVSLWKHIETIHPSTSEAAEDVPMDTTNASNSSSIASNSFRPTDGPTTRARAANRSLNSCSNSSLGGSTGGDVSIVSE